MNEHPVAHNKYKSPILSVKNFSTLDPSLQDSLTELFRSELAGEKYYFENGVFGSYETNPEAVFDGIKLKALKELLQKLSSEINLQEFGKVDVANVNIHNFNARVRVLLDTKESTDVWQECKAIQIGIVCKHSDYKLPLLTSLSFKINNIPCLVDENGVVTIQLNPLETAQWGKFDLSSNNTYLSSVLPSLTVQIQVDSYRIQASDTAVLKYVPSAVSKCCADANYRIHT